MLPAPAGIQAVAPAAASRLATRGPRTVAVIMVNFASLPATPWTADDARAAVFTAPASLNAFEQEQSFGAVALAGKLRADGDVFGWYTIPQGTATCEPDAWMAGANAAAGGAGVDLTGYQHRIYVFPRVAACAWSGAADMPGTDSFINGSLAVRVLAHELGHNLGAEHASALTCVDGAGVSVSFSSSCVLDEYGDPYDVMGTSERHYAAFRKGEAGFLAASSLATVAQTGTYRLASSSVVSNGTVSLRVQRGAAPDYWYMDLRSPAGLFENVAVTDPTVTGVTIRLAGDYRTATRTRLIDAAPQTATFADAPLQGGQTFADPTSGISITVESVGLGVASVRVTVPGTAPLNPASIAATAVAASSRPAQLTASAFLRRVSAHRGILRVTVPVAATSHRCSIRVARGRPIRCRAAGTRATMIRSVALNRQALPVQVRLDGHVVLSVRLRVPRTGQMTRLVKALSWI
jgi:hypothetical protein